MRWPFQIDFSRKVSAQSSGKGFDQQSPDLETLLIVAGSCGSGKSTIIRFAYQQDLPLFGAGYQECFRSSCQDKTFKEFDDYETALRRSSYFQSSHVKKLGRENHLPPNILLHLDLYQVLRGIDQSYWPKPLKKRALVLLKADQQRAGAALSSLKLGKRGYESLQSRRDNDLMMQFYLGRRFFQRFRRIVVTTVECSYSDNSLQLSGRKSRSTSLQPFKYFAAPEPVAQTIHSEIYACWKRTLSVLNPAAVHRANVSESGDLLLNNSVLVPGWSSRFQRIA